MSRCFQTAGRLCYHRRKRGPQCATFAMSVLGRSYARSAANLLFSFRKSYRCAQCNNKADQRLIFVTRPHPSRSAAKSLRARVPEWVIMATGGWKTAAMFRRRAMVSSADQCAAIEALERWRAAQNGPEQPPKASEAGAIWPVM